MILTGKISVTPERLNEKGIELQHIIKSLTLQLDELANVVNSSESYWVGTAGNAVRDEYMKLNGEVQEVLKRLGEHPRDLQKMAGIYKRHDMEALQKTEVLPGSILE